MKKQSFKNGLGFFLIIACLPLTQCISSGAESQASLPISDTELSTAFPSQFAVASPFDVTASSSVNAGLTRTLAEPSEAFATW